MEESQQTPDDIDVPEVATPPPTSGNLECAVPEKPISPCRPWGQWATIGWSVLCLMAMTSGESVAPFVPDALGMPRGGGQAPVDADLNGNLLEVATFVGTLATVGLIVFLVRARRCSVREYLALKWPSARSVLMSVVGMAVLLVALDLTSYLSGRPLVPPVIVSIYRTAWLPGLVFAFIVLAPLGEETLFRGFLYEGIAASRAGPIGAIAISATAWAMLHLQYDLYGIASIAVAGFYLGAVRYMTGSLFLTMLLHALQNAVGTIELVVQEYWLK
jgi:uncharacterized protein